VNYQGHISRKAAMRRARASRFGCAVESGYLAYKARLIGRGQVLAVTRELVLQYLAEGVISRHVAALAQQQ
jgi:hypothetical protein